jgi:hypothetical protein
MLFNFSSLQKSSFSKFDQLSKKTVLHVRSVDAAKVQKQFNQVMELNSVYISGILTVQQQVPFSDQTSH